MVRMLTESDSPWRAVVSALQQYMPKPHCRNSTRGAQADAGSVQVDVVSVSTGALNPGQTIAAYADAKRAELLVVGSRGIGAVAGCEGLRSSVMETRRDLAHADCAPRWDRFAFGHAVVTMAAPAAELVRW